MSTVIAQFGNTVPINVNRGETVVIDFEVLDKNSVLIDLTGSVITVDLKKLPGKDDTLSFAKLTTSDALSVVGTSNQRIRMTYAFNLKYPVIYYNIKVVHPSGVTFYPYNGPVNINLI